ncbi:MAG: DnaB-like helicase C-terminal domain-containing protein [bacterium]
MSTSISRTEANFLHHEPCPNCGSRDNLARYDDGHGWCFGCQYYEPGEEQEPKVTRLSERKLTPATLRKWGYKGMENGEEYAFYHDPKTREVVAVKIRTPDKQFRVSYAAGKVPLPLYGQHLWKRGGRRLIITEGEIDAMTVSQVLGHKWPVVSVPNGAAGAKKSIQQNLEWVNSFDQVVYCFDQDDTGRNAVHECIGLHTPGKVFIVRLNGKDPSAVLMAGHEQELVRALWDAEPYSPDGIVTVQDVLEAASSRPEMGMPYWQKELTEATYGRRYGEVVGLGAGTGVGKSTWLTQQIAYDLRQGNPVAVFAFEQLPAETVRRVAGCQAKKPLHIPDGRWTDEDLRDAIKGLADGPPLYLYDHFGSAEWANVKERIRYLRHAYGVRIFYIDHLTALAEHGDDERKSLEKMMAEVSSLAVELDIWILYVSHLSTPDGRPHEEGGRVMIRHFKGSRSIGYWTHFIFGLEREQQSEDLDERNSSVFRVLKDRFTGQSLGRTWTLHYDSKTGLMSEGKPDMFQPLTEQEEPKVNEQSRKETESYPSF